MSETFHPCCDSASPSSTWEGKSRGKIINIGDIETYIANPPQNAQQATSGKEKEKRVLLHLTEGHSIYFLNAQLLADSFAAGLGCDVIMPDQFHGTRRIPTTATSPHFPPGKAEIPPPIAGSDEIPPPYPQVQTEEEFEAWKAATGPSVMDPLIARIVQYIRETYGEDVKIAGVG